MFKLAVVVDFASEVRIRLVGGFEDDLERASAKCEGGNWPMSCLGVIGELVRGQIDFSKGALSNQAAESVVADGLEVVAGKFAARGRRGSVGRGDGGNRGRRTLGDFDTSLQADGTWPVVSDDCFWGDCFLGDERATPTFALRPCASALTLVVCIAPRRARAGDAAPPDVYLDNDVKTMIGTIARRRVGNWDRRRHAWAVLVVVGVGRPCSSSGSVESTSRGNQQG